MKKRKVDPWFPFWIDKWLFGSTRIELAPDERGVFIDLMSLSKKDDGYIRANEGVPYLDNQLCGLFNITTELLHRTIKKCIKYGKTKKLKDGTLYMISHDAYKLSDRQERRVESEMTDKKDIEAEKVDAILNKKRINNKRKYNKDKVKKFDQLFKKFWTRYPRKEHKLKAKEKYMHLIKVKKVNPQKIEDALTGYINVEVSKGTEMQYLMYAKTFLYPGKKGEQGTWEEYIPYADPKYKYKPKI